MNQKTIFFLGIFLSVITLAIITINAVIEDNFQEEVKIVNPATGEAWDSVEEYRFRNPLDVEVFITPSGAHLEVSRETGEFKVLKEAIDGNS